MTKQRRLKRATCAHRNNKARRQGSLGLKREGEGKGRGGEEERGGERRREVGRGGERWREVERGGERWREVERGGERWREVEREEGRGARWRRQAARQVVVWCPCTVPSRCRLQLSVVQNPTTLSIVRY